MSDEIEVVKTPNDGFDERPYSLFDLFTKMRELKSPLYETAGFTFFRQPGDMFNLSVKSFLVRTRPNWMCESEVEESFFDNKTISNDISVEQDFEEYVKLLVGAVYESFDVEEPVEEEMEFVDIQIEELFVSCLLAGFALIQNTPYSELKFNLERNPGDGSIVANVMLCLTSFDEANNQQVNSVLGNFYFPISGPVQDSEETTSDQQD